MRDQPLRAEVVDGRLVVSIGVDVLVTAIEGGDGWEQHGMAVTDRDAFVAAVAVALVEEGPDGSTIVHESFDGAADWVVEDEATGLSPAGAD